MSDRFENAPPPEGWIVETRPCPLCTVKACGCPSEPLPVLRHEDHLILGEN